MLSLNNVTKKHRGKTFMKIKRIFLVIGIAMLIFAIGFVIFALNNPQASFPWNNTITYSIYAVYLIVMVVSFILSIALPKHTK